MANISSNYNMSHTFQVKPDLDPLQKAVKDLMQRFNIQEPERKIQEAVIEYTSEILDFTGRMAKSEPAEAQTQDTSAQPDVWSMSWLPEPELAMPKLLSHLLA